MATIVHNIPQRLSLDEVVNHFIANRLEHPVYRFQQTLKRMADCGIACVLVLLLSPVLLLIAILVKWTSPGPILYKSLRLGQNRKPFCMLKFRTMRQNSDYLRAQLRQNNKQEDRLFKLEHDPRVTSLGRVLRKFSLDEFPQLFNVIKGDMSLVGPRPFTPDDCTLFEPPHTLRFKAIPGMTGLWQVSGRSLLNFQDSCMLDTRYVLEWNLAKDMFILLQTIPAVCFNTGAY